MSLVHDVAELVAARYVFPETGRRAAHELTAREAAGRFAGLDEASLAAALTDDLHEICHDWHLRVRLQPPDRPGEGSEEDREDAWRDGQRRTNFGIAKVERLTGNVGLLDLHGITHPGVGGGAIAAAMALVAHTEALVIDLRRNRGGAPQGVAMWCSYFFPDDETHLNDVYDAETRLTRQFWTWAHVPGERYLDRPVWVLTSHDTFSGGEELAYNLKVQGRGTLIGETTKGGAHPTTVLALSPTLELTLPVARSINPVTGTNWEGVGVEPDVPASAEDALRLAHAAAAQHVLEVAPGSLAAREAVTVLQVTAS